MQVATPATPARAMPTAKVTVLTHMGLIPKRAAVPMSSEAPRTALPNMVFFRNRKTKPVAMRATTALWTRVRCMCSDLLTANGAKRLT